MGILQRVNRIVKANINDLVDKAEDPVKVIKELIREMEGAVRETQTQTAYAIAGLKKLQKQEADNQAQVALWEERATMALQRGDEELAKQALRRKKLYDDQAAPLSQQIEQQQRAVDTLKTSLAALRLKLEEAKAQSKVLIARAQRAKSQQKVAKVVGSATNTSAFDDFERMAEKIDDRETEVAAATEVQLAGVDQRFADAEADADVEADLAALKQKLAGGAAPAAPGK